MLGIGVNYNSTMKDSMDMEALGFRVRLGV